MALQKVEEKWGRQFVIVASQDSRNSMLFPETTGSNIDLSISNYCLLERLARARYSGEVSNGKYSLADIVGDPTNFHSIK